MITGSGWPYINMSELNMDWIFKELIPQVKSLKESYDNIQDIVKNITQENYNQWKAELQTEMSRLQTQITQANETWKQTFAAQNAAWQQQAKNELNTRFSEYQTLTNAAIEAWEHDAYNRLQQLINSFGESIVEAEANAKRYADQQVGALRTEVQQQLHLLNDQLLETNRELAAQVKAINDRITELRTEWNSFRQDVNQEVNEFEDRMEEKLQQHREWLQQQLISINNNIMEQVRLLNERISKLTATDIGAIDPLTGEEENVQFVLRHMFDVFSEYNGCITAGEYKQLEITAGEYKEKYNYQTILYSIASYYLLKIRQWVKTPVHYNGEYVTPAELEQRLMDYITKAAVDAELADYALTNDVDQKLAQYIKTKDMISYLATTLENYVTYDSLQTTLQDYARLEDIEQFQTELNSKATQEQLESLRQSVYDEFDKYAKLSELPDFTEFLGKQEAADTFATLEELNEYALKSTVASLNQKVNTNQTAIVTALSQHISDANSRFALKSAVPAFKTIDFPFPLRDRGTDACVWTNGGYTGIANLPVFYPTSPSYMRLVYSSNPDTILPIYRFNPSLESIEIDGSSLNYQTTMIVVYIGHFSPPSDFPLGNIRMPITYIVHIAEGPLFAKIYHSTQTGYISIGNTGAEIWAHFVMPLPKLTSNQRLDDINILLSSTGMTPTKRSE